MRLLRHLFTPDWVVKRAFPRPVLAAIEQAIAASEKLHSGELRFAVEGGLHPAALWHGQTTRERAEQLFALLRVWDTEHNSGVLVYVQLVERRIEIVADRGIAARVAQTEWESICREMERGFAVRCFQDGALAAVTAITALLARHFPAGGDNPNELPDQPVVY
jgi:uncharacterized membrane protein